jgi:hypothetical protein
MGKIPTSSQLKRLYWNEERSVPEIAKRTGVPAHALYEVMRRHRIPRRGRSESNYLVSRSKPQFQLKSKLSPEEERLKIAGIMLYWGEGAQLGPTVDFSNSKPEMIRVFLRFLREICGVGESRLRVYLYHHGAPRQVKSSMKFWQRITGIPLTQFQRPYVRKGNPHYSGRIMPHGLIHIRYSDTRLREIISHWIDEYVAKINRAGTREAKWGGL